MSNDILEITCEIMKNNKSANPLGFTQRELKDLVNKEFEYLIDAVIDECFFIEHNPRTDISFTDTGIYAKLRD
ncbi:hypothetical protein [Bartonella sp. DGB1]|uniref:hypothetical protein n=1 Tax=Bartonella sp. DGB1 TaxID=3239807 RepID=UPI0035240732